MQRGTAEVLMQTLYTTPSGAVKLFESESAGCTFFPLPLVFFCVVETFSSIRARSPGLRTHYSGSVNDTMVPVDTTLKVCGGNNGEEWNAEGLSNSTSLRFAE